MKAFNYLFLFIFGLLALASCGDDDPRIIFHEQEGIYSIGSGRELQVTFNGVTLTDTKTSVVVSFPGDKVAELTLIQVLPDNSRLTVGGLVVTTLSDGSGIAFEGEMAKSQTEKLVIKGEISNDRLTLDLQTVEIPV